MFGRIDIDEYERDRKKELAVKLTAGAILATILVILAFFAFRFTAQQGTVQEIIQTQDWRGNARKILIVNDYQYYVWPVEAVSLHIGDKVIIRENWFIVHVTKEGK